MARQAKEKESTALTPWRPFMDLTGWEMEMDRMMDDFFGRRRRSWWPERWLGRDGGEFSGPAIDLYEAKDDIVVKAELPGMSKDDIEVNLSDRSLTIKGEKKKEEEIKEGNYY